MRSSRKEQGEGAFHQVKGKIKGIVGKIVQNRDLEAEGKDGILAGKAQEKIGEIEKVVGK